MSPSSGGLRTSRSTSSRVERVADCGDKVLVYAREEGRGSLSGGTVSQRIYTVCTFRDGKVARYQEFYEERDALEAAGLSE